jgi:hypothetical protein
MPNSLLAPKTVSSATSFGDICFFITQHYDITSLYQSKNCFSVFCSRMKNVKTGGRFVWGISPVVKGSE